MISFKYGTWNNGKYATAGFNVLIWFTVYTGLGFLNVLKGLQDTEINDLEKYSILVFVVSILLFLLFSFISTNVFLRFNQRELKILKDNMKNASSQIGDSFLQGLLSLYNLNLTNDTLKCIDCSNQK